VLSKKVSLSANPAAAVNAMRFVRLSQNKDKAKALVHINSIKEVAQFPSEYIPIR